jgi:thiol-disulfide isomerase/thioredoxin
MQIGSLVLAVGLGLTLGACSSSDASCSGSSTSGGFVSCDGAITVLSPAEREPAPSIEGETLDGERRALADYDGQVVVLNVWGSWCGPCIAEAPALNEASRELAPDDVQFVGINIRDERTAAQLFETQQDVPYPSIFDPPSSTLLEMPAGMYPSATPTTYVIDAQGRIAVRVLDATTAPTLIGLTEDVLAEASAEDSDG